MRRIGFSRNVTQRKRHPVVIKAPRRREADDRIGIFRSVGVFASPRAGLLASQRRDTTYRIGNSRSIAAYFGERRPDELRQRLRNGPSYR